MLDLRMSLMSVNNGKGDEKYEKTTTMSEL